MSISPASPHHHAHAATILVIDPDIHFLSEITRLGEQLIVRVLAAKDVEQAAQFINEPGLDSIFITVPDESIVSLPQMFLTLASARNDKRLPPFALLYEKQGLLVRAHNTTQPIALALQKPLSRNVFSQAVHYLSSLQNQVRLKILLLDANDEAAQSLNGPSSPSVLNLYHLRHPATLLDELDMFCPDLLMIHTRTPVLNGLEICRIVRTIPAWLDLPILFITDQPTASERLAAFEAGGDDYLTNPIAMGELAARLRGRIARTRVIRDRADRDMLTGLLNRRAFVEQLAGRLAEVSRHARPLAFCLLDLDRFKQINDTYGHLAGDRVLATLGRLLALRFRLEDVSARWGGEEFAVILVNETSQTARIALQRVADEFAEIPFHSEELQTFHVTFSAGISHFPADGNDSEALLYAADQRLLHAKQAGRNRILSPSSHPPEY